MKYANNDLWSVRQIEFLEDALKGYENLHAIYYPTKTLSLEIPEIATYNYTGVLHFPGKDRTIILEQGDDFGLSQAEVTAYLDKLSITYTIK